MLITLFTVNYSTKLETSEENMHHLKYTYTYEYKQLYMDKMQKLSSNCLSIYKEN